MNDTTYLVAQEKSERDVRDYRCVSCGRLLFRARLTVDSTIKIRCPRCNHMVLVANRLTYKEKDV